MRISTTTTPAMRQEGTHAVEVERVLFVDEPSRESDLDEFSGMVYALPGSRRDCAVRLPLRICRRTGILGGMKGAPLIKNSVPFYRSQSAILHTHGAYTAFVCVQAGGATYEGEVQVQVNVCAAQAGLARLLPRPE